MIRDQVMLYHDCLDNLGPEVRKTYKDRIASGFFDRYFSGRSVLDIGFRGRNPNAIPIVPHAIGVDRDFPNYDGRNLPFPDQSQDTVHSSHCLEHIRNPTAALAEWFRVLKIGGFLVLTVPHHWLYERKPVPTSRWGGNEHLRFYTAGGLMAEIEAALPIGEYRMRSLRDNDTGFDYSIPAGRMAVGCYEIEAVLERIARPIFADSLVLSPEAAKIVAAYRLLIGAALAGEPVDLALLMAPIPPFRLICNLFPAATREQLYPILRPKVDGSVVDVEWYTRVHPDVRGDPRLHYENAGYFECKAPSTFDPPWS